jgi:DNA-binding protein YbaB
VSDDRLDHMRALADEGAALAAQARAAEQRASGATATDRSGAVTVTLDDQGRVSGVAVANGWRRLLGSLALDEAVIEAVGAATRRRFEAWGDAYADQAPAPADFAWRRPDGDAYADQARVAADSADRDDVARRQHSPVAAGSVDREDFARRLQEAAGGGGPMSVEDSEVALRELLALVESIDQGLDEVSGALDGALRATYTGRSSDRKVQVTVTGGGDVTAVGYDRQWLLQAHEINIARQTAAAFRAAYLEAGRHGVREIVADSRLGEAQQLAQDPLGLARRLRLTD